MWLGNGVGMAWTCLFHFGPISVGALRLKDATSLVSGSGMQKVSTALALTASGFACLLKDKIITAISEVHLYLSTPFDCAGNTHLLGKLQFEKPTKRL